VVWSPIVFGERFAALTMATDVTERLRVEHRNAVFSNSVTDSVRPPLIRGGHDHL